LAWLGLGKQQTAVGMSRLLHNIDEHVLEKLVLQACIFTVACAADVTLGGCLQEANAETRVGLQMYRRTCPCIDR
jgi:hypothetical protein